MLEPSMPTHAIAPGDLLQDFTLPTPPGPTYRSRS